MGRNVVRKEQGVPTKREDLYSWAVRQAELLRAGRLSEIDAAAIAEEIDDVGMEEYHRLESALRVVMLHLLKWDHQPDRRSRSWTLSILEHRRRVHRQLRGSLGLKSRLDEALEGAYEDARLEAASETGLPLSLFPVRRPFEHAEVMERSIVWAGDEE
ncbi:MAG TPA: DUF29 domain-containing protein [Roseiarcus sp.]|nr:DUF29 domain-containing protein [Roseiarcus sp.]